MINKYLKASVGILSMASIMAGIFLLSFLLLGIPEFFGFFVSGTVGGCYIGCKATRLVI